MEEKDYDSLEELFAEGAPKHLIDSIKEQLFVNPVLTAEGQTFSLDTLKSNGMINPTTRSKVETYFPNKLIAEAVDEYLEQRIAEWLDEVSAILDAQKKGKGTQDPFTAVERLLLLARLVTDRDLTSCLNAQRRIVELCGKSFEALERVLGIFINSTPSTLDSLDSPQIGLLRLLAKHECYDLLNLLLASSSCRVLFPKDRKVAQAVFGGLWALSNSADVKKKSFGRNLLLHWKPPVEAASMTLLDNLLGNHKAIVREALSKAGAIDIQDILSLQPEDAADLGLPLVPRRRFLEALAELKKTQTSGAGASPLWEQANDDSEYETPKTTPIVVTPLSDIAPILTPLKPVAKESSPLKPPTPLQVTPSVQSVTYSLWVGNLPLNITENTLRNFFVSFGELHSVSVHTSPKGGYAFINFFHEQPCNSALEAINNKQLFGSEHLIKANKQQKATHTLPDLVVRIEAPLPKIEYIKKNKPSLVSAFAAAGITVKDMTLAAPLTFEVSSAEEREICKKVVDSLLASIVVENSRSMLLPAGEKFASAHTVRHMMGAALFEAEKQFHVSVFVQDESRPSDGTEKKKETRSKNTYRLCIAGFSTEDVSSAKDFLVPFTRVMKDKYPLSSVREQEFFNRVCKRWEKKHGIAMQVDAKLLTVWALGEDRMANMKKKISHVFASKVIITYLMQLQPHECAFLKEHKWKEVEKAAKQNHLRKYFITGESPEFAKGLKKSDSRSPIKRGRGGPRGGGRGGYASPVSSPHKYNRKKEYHSKEKEPKDYESKEKKREYPKEKKEKSRKPGSVLKLVGSKRAVDAVREVVSCLLEGLKSLEFVKVVAPAEKGYALNKELGRLSHRLGKELGVAMEFEKVLLASEGSVAIGEDSDKPGTITYTFKLAGQAEVLHQAKKSIKSTVAAATIESLPLGQHKNWSSIFSQLKEKRSEFQTEWKVTVLLDYKRKCIVFIGKNAEVTASAKSALEAQTVGKTMCTKKIKYDTPERVALFHLLTVREQEGLKRKGKENGVTIIWTAKKKILLKGIQSKVEEVAGLIANMETSFKLKQEDHDWPILFLPALKEHNYAFLAKIEKTHCVSAWLKSATDSGGANGVVARHTLDNGAIMEICKGDLLKANAEVIVNAANEQLQHAGGIAQTISRAAGKQFTDDCAAWIAANKRLATGEAQLCRPGDLKNKFSGIINAVGPVYKQGVQGQDRLLASAVRKSLEVADSHGYTSVALPAISTGIYGFPLHWAATILVGQVQDYLANRAVSLKVVRITDMKADTIDHLAAALKEMKNGDRKEKELFPSCNQNDETATEWKWQWYWQEDDGQFVPYDHDQNVQIEKQFAEEKMGVVANNRDTFQVTGDRLGVKNNFRYRIIFSEMVQQNTQTGKKRKLNRERIRAPKSAPVLPSSSREEEEEFYLAISNPMAPFTVRFVGLAEDVGKAIGMVDAFYLSKKATKSINLKAPLSESDMNKLHKRLMKHNVELTNTSSSIDLVGLDSDVVQATSEVAQFLMERMESSLVVAYPPEWVPQKRNYELSAVDAGSTEWVKVERRMKETLPQCRIIKLERVQNKLLWERYVHERTRVTKKNNGTTNEIEVFHGCRGTNPIDIYGGEDGFDMRFSQAGMWGQGIYFAANASYSLGYSSSLPDGSKQFFLARAAAGSVYTCASDSKLRLPPVKPSTSGQFATERYDCVSGTTGNSVVYIFYHNCMAYPFYLITYVS